MTTVIRILDQEGVDELVDHKLNEADKLKHLESTGKYCLLYRDSGLYLSHPSLNTLLDTVMSTLREDDIEDTKFSSLFETNVNRTFLVSRRSMDAMIKALKLE